MMSKCQTFDQEPFSHKKLDFSLAKIFKDEEIQVKMKFTRGVVILLSLYQLISHQLSTSISNHDGYSMEYCWGGILDTSYLLQPKEVLI
jgi:hypothetical protein